MADKAFKSEQEETRSRMVTFGERMATFEEAVKLVAEGGFERFVQQLNDQRRATETIIDTVHRTLAASSTQSVSALNDRTDEQLAELWTRIQTKFADVEVKIQRAVAGGGGQGDGFGPSSSSGLPRGSYQLRVPEPQNWKLDMLKDGESGFAKWRKSFDLQVNAVWNGLDKLLEEIRGHDYVDVIIDEGVYRSLLLKAGIHPSWVA